MLDPGRRQGCQNKGRSEELRRECLRLRSRGQNESGDEDKDGTVDWQDVPVRSGSKEMEILFVSANNATI